MRKGILLTAILLLPSYHYAQKIATTFQQAIKQHRLSIEELDRNYASALHADTTQAAFGEREKEFVEAYGKLLADLSDFLKENNFFWGKTTRCFNRIYFNKDGRIDYFLFNFNPGQLSRKKEKQFERLVGLFILHYQFPMTCETRFAQCSPVKYGDQ